jgi:hypothetical protein
MICLPTVTLFNQASQFLSYNVLVMMDHWMSFDITSIFLIGGKDNKNSLDELLANCWIDAEYENTQIVEKRESP